MLHRLVRALWGDLRGQELKKFILLASGFFFLIGAWWPLKTIKDSIFINMVGPLYLPNAKLASVAVFFPLVLFYSKLVDHFSKQRLIYIVIGVYTTVGLGLVWLLRHPELGLANPEVGASRWVGWAFYLFCESYISLMMALYWSFINDITTPESAKKGYGLIIFGTQLGGFLFTILGNYLSTDTTQYTSVAPLIACISVLMFVMVAVIVFFLEHYFDKDAQEGYADHAVSHEKPSEEKVKFLDGLKLLLSHPYVMGIFGVIFFQEVVSTVMGYQLQLLVKTTYIDPGTVNKFLFDYGLAVQAVACFFGLVGTSFFQRKLGINGSLMSYPVLLSVSVICYMVSPTLNTIFYVMLISKALGYALNQPAKEALYIPTSKSIKYKSKAWIDMFGLRFAKAAGSEANKLLGPVVSLSGGLVLGIIGIWVFVAGLLGRTFNKTVEANKLIE